jgi:indole-3-glycerol phosphate synthase
MTYLDAILNHKRRIWSDPSGRPHSKCLVTHTAAPGGRFRQALAGSCVSLIAEIKPKSPSRGPLLAPENAVPQARTYSAYGAAAVSVLADDEFFGGSPELVAQIAADPKVDVPVLYKDFIVDPRQVAVAAGSGADAVLLIVRAVDDSTLRLCTELARELGLDPLHECSTEQDIERALAAGADLVGINNRDLQTFAVDLDTAARLRTMVPADIAVVSESGLHTRTDVEAIAALGFDACLVGEALLTAADLPQTIAELSSVKSCS